jgi:hypothetical protein
LPPEVGWEDSKPVSWVASLLPTIADQAGRDHMAAVGLIRHYSRKLFRFSDSGMERTLSFL